MILSVGYRVKSDKGILFRKWATNVLKDYMLKGYAINQKRLDYLEKTNLITEFFNKRIEQQEVYRRLNQRFTGTDEIPPEKNPDLISEYDKDGFNI